MGFYFTSSEEFQTKSAALRNERGDPVEEFEIQFIEGEDIDAALVAAVGLRQGDLAGFFEKTERWDETDKKIIAIAVGECGYQFSWAHGEPGEFDVDLYGVETLRELAEIFVDEGLFGDIPDRIVSYLDHDAIARDLGMDYTETTIAGARLVYRCG